ncbi:MAG: winged helix DNA-binding protein [Limnochordia bacterium]
MNCSKETEYLTAVFCLRLLWDNIYEYWNKAAADQGLTVTEELVLWVISLYDSSTVSDVAARLHRDKGTISKCIYSLEESGLIVRKAGTDRRSYTFELTEEGERIKKILGSSHRLHSVFREAFAGLSGAEQETLLMLLTKLTAEIEGEAYLARLKQSMKKIAEAMQEQ